MKRTITIILSALAMLAGFIISAVCKWWIVWLDCFPLVYVGLFFLGREFGLFDGMKEDFKK